MKSKNGKSPGTIVLPVDRGSTAPSRRRLDVRPDGKGKIWSHIRAQWYVETPEELVRQQYVCRLANDYGYLLDQMGEELKVQRGRQSAEADVVIWRSARDKIDKQSPLIVIETKADNVT